MPFWVKKVENKTLVRFKKPNVLNKNKDIKKSRREMSNASNRFKREYGKLIGKKQ